MGDSNHPDLVKVTEIFLVPSSFLVAALGTADTNPHRAMVSLLGFVISLLWLACSYDASLETATGRSRRTNILLSLPVVFGAGWFCSTVAHLMLWNRPLG